jgi:hypothetical protein
MRYKKVVGLGLTFQAINFAQSEFMGHRVRFSVAVDYMNQYFRWTRSPGEVRPTARFLNAGVEDSPVDGLPTFTDFLAWTLGSVSTDVDGVADGLNYSSSALDTYNDSKRSEKVLNWASVADYDAEPADGDVGDVDTHYGANDLVMAYVLFKCFGSSSFDAAEIIYNLEDAFGMLTSEALATAISDSLVAEDVLAGAVLDQDGADGPKLGNRGKVDDMFRALLAADPKRFFKNGKQIDGLFESNPDVEGDASGNWCLKPGDVIEIPIKLYFTAPVTVLSVVDNPKEPSSDTPANPETVVIKGEPGEDAETPYDPNAEDAAVANRENTMSVRLQLLCSAPLNEAGLTYATSEETVDGEGEAPLVAPLKVTTQMNLIFYNGPYYPAQSAIAILTAGGDLAEALAYSTEDAIAGVTLNEETGVITFNRLDEDGVPLEDADAPVNGKFPMTVKVTRGEEEIDVDIIISIDDGTGSSNTVVDP